MAPLEPAVPGVVMEPSTLVRRIPLAPHQLTDRITPTDALFVLAHLGIPSARSTAAGPWTLEIDGLVERPGRLAFGELLERPKRLVQAMHQCAGYPHRPDLPTRRIANVVWGGVDLAELLAERGIRPEARYLWSFGIDHGEYDGEQVACYVKDLPLERLGAGGAILAYEVNGEPLPLAHGSPLRLVVPGFYGTNSVKWLYRLELRDRRAPGPFTTVFYNDPVAPDADHPAGATRPVWGVAPESVIVAPAPGSTLPVGTHDVWGWAWAERGVERVEISADGGASWQPALVEPRLDWSWQRYSCRWTTARQGRVTLASRAFDGLGATQPEAGARNAIHSVEIDIASGR